MFYILYIMTSQNLKNSFEMYCQDQTRQQRLMLTRLDKDSQIRNDRCIPDLGINMQGLSGGYNNHVLSNNTADIESNLFGIGATNLAKPKTHRFNPSINDRKNCKFFDTPALVMPSNFVVNNNQRPSGPFS